MQQELVEHLTCSVEAFTGPIMRICGELRESNMKMDQPFIYKLREQAHVCFAILKIPVASRLPFHLVAISTVRNGFNPLQNAFYVRSWYSQTGDGHGVFAKKRTFIDEPPDTDGRPAVAATPLRWPGTRRTAARLVCTTWPRGGHLHTSRLNVKTTSRPLTEPSGFATADCRGSGLDQRVPRAPDGAVTGAH